MAADDWSDQSGSCWSWLWWFLKKEQGGLPNQLTLPFTSNFFVALRMLFNSIFTSSGTSFKIILATVSEANLGVLTLYAVKSVTDTGLWWRKVQSLLQRQARRMDRSGSKDQMPRWFPGKGFKGKMMETDRVYDHLCTLFWLVWWWGTGWCFWNLNYQPSGSKCPGVYILMVSIQLTFSLGGGFRICKTTQGYGSGQNL